MLAALTKDRRRLWRPSFLLVLLLGRGARRGQAPQGPRKARRLASGRAAEVQEHQLPVAPGAQDQAPADIGLALALAVVVLPEGADASPRNRHALLGGDGRVPVLVELAEDKILQRPERVQHPAVALERPHRDSAGKVSFAFLFFSPDLAVVVVVETRSGEKFL